MSRPGPGSAGGAEEGLRGIRQGGERDHHPDHHADDPQVHGGQAGEGRVRISSSGRIISTGIL